MGAQGLRKTVSGARVAVAIEQKAALLRIKPHQSGGRIGQLQQQAQALDLLAEELRLAQNALGEITGQFSADDLLGVIFSKFCIGK